MRVSMVAPSAPRDARSKIPPGPEGSNGIDRRGRRGQPAGSPPFQPHHLQRRAMHGAGGNKGTERIHSVELFAQRNRNGGIAGEFRMRADIVIPHRLLEPEQIEIARQRAEALAGGQVPFAIAVDGHGDAVAHRT